MDTDRVIAGDSWQVLDSLDAESVHAIVTDPPYGLAFMGRDWDDFEPKEYQEWCEVWAKKAKRVLKPGGHLVAFSGNRTHHRLFSGVEDAGFEVRDTLTWHYGSGFPKGLDVSKAIDKREGAEREVIADNPNGRDTSQDKYETPINAEERDPKITAPATEAAKEWDGWKTHLKPATEFIVLGRKPLPGTVAECVTKHGTGALNIGDCRLENDIDEFAYTERSSERNQTDYSDAERSDIASASPEGRYPANLLLDSVAADRLDAETESTESTDTPRRNSESAQNDSKYGESSEGGWVSHGHNDSGGVSRYFYTSKASKAERTLDGRIDNPHPTVKPIDLMEWLIKLVSREGQTVLDPFTGSGTTLKAAKNLNREFIGVEQKPEYADIARVRVGLTPEDPSVVRSGVNRGLEEYQ